jgi:hypothetical protein
MKLRAKLTLFATAAILSWTVLCCGGPTIITPDTPPPSPNPDVKADCKTACENIGPKTDETPDGLDCEEGKPTADGQTCQQVCEGMPNTTQDYLDCVATVTTCEQIPKCPH